MLIPLRRVHHVAVVGGGFSGTMQVVNLLRHGVPEVTLIERTPRLGRGLAYSTHRIEHLLNVRASNMSAYPDDADHFRRWLAARHPEITGMFVPRLIYGDYLQDQLTQITAGDATSLRLVQATATSLDEDDTDLVLSLDNGDRIRADRVVLALGNFPPHPPAGLDTTSFDASRYIADPWRDDLGAGLTDEDHVLIVGTGLTMIDVVLTLDAEGFRGRITAMSRRGLTPHVHEAGLTPPLVPPERPASRLVDLVRQIRASSEQHGWRSVVDGLRPYTRDMWLGADPRDQSAFLRHLRPWWDIHRHRLAPVVEARIAGLRDQGRLSVVAAKTQSFRPVSEGVEVQWRMRGEDRVQQSRFRRIINCTGPQGDLLMTRDPLLRDLLGKGWIRADRHRMGIDVTPQCEVIGDDGAPDPRLLALGPMTRGAFWEVIAVPDIRMQAWALARRIANAHWVGGEGL